jgi:hypothetical protein
MDNDIEATIEIAEQQRGRPLGMQTFRLDQLFGLALTDARFFRQLREVPKAALAQFDLTESEERAILDIAASVNSIEELAMRLEHWQMCVSDASVEARGEDHIAVLSPTAWRLWPAKVSQVAAIPERVSGRAAQGTAE